MLIGPGGSVEGAGSVDVRPGEIDLGEQPGRSTLTPATRCVRFRPEEGPAGRTRRGSKLSATRALPHQW